MMIILSGGGDPEAVIPIDEYFVSALDLHKTVLYIPVAMEEHVFSYDECYEWFKGVYGQYGITNIELCTDLKSLRLNNRFSAVFIGGGNTFKLLHEMQHSDFAIQIRSYLEAGGILYGGSAGAIVCGKTIEPTFGIDVNSIGINDFSALNLLNGFDAFCHYDPDKHTAFVDKLNCDSYLLFEKSGIVFNGSSISSIGRPFMLKTSLLFS